MDNKKKNILLISGVILLILVISGLTYAWFTWSTTSSEETKIVTSFGSATVYYDAGSDITGVGLRPTATKEEGIVRNISVNSDTNVPLSFNLYLDVLTLPDDLKDASFKYELYKEGTTTALASGNFSAATLVECTVNSTNHIVLLTDEAITTTKSNYTLYLWIDGNMSNPNEMQNKTFNFKLHADGSNANVKQGATGNLIQYLSNLYNLNFKTEISHTDSTEEITYLTYNYVPNVGLMNDRLASNSVGLDDGNIRFYGSTPNNYIDIGDKDSNGNVVLWRIIGLFKNIKLSDGTTTDLIKIIRNDSIGKNAWNTGNRNNWTASSLMSILNTGSYFNGLSTTVKDRIQEVVWNIGTWHQDDSYLTTIYSSERSATTHTGYASEWTGKVALMYASDYGYASDLSICNSSRGSCSDNWLLKEHAQWLLTSNGYSVYSGWYVTSTSVFGSGTVADSFNCYPTFYLRANSTLIGGTGTVTDTINDPYVLG